jgi:hypothetical protein
MPILNNFKQYGTLFGVKWYNKQVVKNE